MVASRLLRERQKNSEFVIRIGLVQFTRWHDDVLVLIKNLNIKLKHVWLDNWLISTPKPNVYVIRSLHRIYAVAL